MTSPGGNESSVAFCGSCGRARLIGTRFCEHCGAEVRSASVSSSPTAAVTSPGQPATSSLSGPPAVPESLTPPQGTAVQSVPLLASSRQPSKRGWIITTCALGAVALVAATVVIVLLLTQHSTPSFLSQARVILRPVAIDNEKLGQAIQSLKTAPNVDAVQSALASTQAEIRAARQELSALNASSDPTLSNGIDAALAAELQWMQDASTTLATPSSPLTSQLSALGLDAQSKLDALGTSIPFLADSAFPSSSVELATYAAATNSSVHEKSLEVTFVGQVLALLNQSSSSYQLVNSFYAQLQSAANGTGTTFTLSQAEQQIGSITSSRTSLAAAAQALSAPTTSS